MGLSMAILDAFITLTTETYLVPPPNFNGLEDLAPFIEELTKQEDPMEPPVPVVPSPKPTTPNLFDLLNQLTAPPQTQQTNQAPAQQINQPPIPPTAAPSSSRRPRKDATKDFLEEMRHLLRKNKPATIEWRKFQRTSKEKCSIRGCIKLRLAFCEMYGGEFAELLQEQRFRSLGSRTKCSCGL
eukprot:Phypoly_transcript_23440.p1 GENE.Phypoly_transcript_23440~~Phypoly_transcript_23440.p1  ORF type:complete len:184 (+),score=27.93 Phypoly_transcript_23440:2-553(+)